jgi:outer membrane receptor for ferrienterochelin and colicins
VDWDTWGLVRFYALQGNSVSNTFQVEGLISPAKRLEVRMAYRYVNSWVDYSEGRRMLPFVSKNRTLINVAYFTRWIDGKHRFSFDATGKWNDGQRLPISGELDGQVSLPSWAPAFWIVNGQVSFSRMAKWDLYLGVENLFNYQQGNAVYYSNDYLDANFTYAPVFGRMAYLGFRWRIGSES